MKNNAVGKFSFFTLTNALIFIIFLFEVFLIASLLKSHRLVIHDSFYRIFLQYYFFNHVVNYGEWPQWVPYLMHGTRTIMWQGMTGVHGFITDFLLLFAGAFKNSNFIPVFYWSVLFDKILLLSGTWLLTRRYYSSIFTRWFITFSIVTTSLWLSQSYYNLYLIYALPLILHFVHSFLETGRWRYVFLSINLWAIQCLDKLAYLVPLTALVVALYLFVYVVVFRKEVSDMMSRLKWGWGAVFSLVFSVLSVVMVYLIFSSGRAEEIAINVYQRNADGTVPLSIFLNYGDVDKNYWKWLELLMGFSLERDYTMYSGLLLVPASILAFFGGFHRKCLPVATVMIIFLLMSMGTIVAEWAYHTWPMMKYFRHLSLLKSIVRLFFCLMAGFGLDYLIASSRKPVKGSHFFSIGVGVVSVLTLSVGFIFLTALQNDANILRLFAWLDYARFDNVDQFTVVLARLFQVAGFKAIICSVLIMLLFMFGRCKWGGALLVSLMFFHLIDVGSYIKGEVDRRTVALSPSQLAVFDIQPMPYRQYRDRHVADNPRNVLLDYDIVAKDFHLWSVDMLLFNDRVAVPLRTDYWMLPVDRYLRALNGQKIDDRSVPVNGLSLAGFQLPQNLSSIENLSGREKGKIRFFKQAYSIAPLDAAALLANKNYAANTLLITGDLQQDHPDLTLPWPGESTLRRDDEMDLSYSVEEFQGDRLDVRVTNPTGHALWMFYSDAWDPAWKVKLNGVEGSIYEASLAYKAVIVPPGENLIQFLFRPHYLIALQQSRSWMHVFWVLIVMGLFLRIIRCPDTNAIENG